MKSNLKTILAMVMVTIALPIGAQMFPNLDMNCVVPYSNDETIAPKNLLLIKMNWEKMSLLNGSLIEIENLRKNLKDIIRNANNLISFLNMATGQKIPPCRSLQDTYILSNLLIKFMIPFCKLT